MRIGKFMIIGACFGACAWLILNPAEAQLRRRSAALQRRAASPQTAAAKASEQRDMVTGTVIQLSPSLIPAAGPAGALGVAAIFYNDVDTSLNSGNLVVTGLPAGAYDAWLVFHDPFARKPIYSELIARFTVGVSGARVETALTIGLPNVINMIHAKQIVVTHQIQTTAQVGQAPIPGAAGYPNGPGKGQAVLAANIK